MKICKGEKYEEFFFEKGLVESFLNILWFTFGFFLTFLMANFNLPYCLDVYTEDNLIVFDLAHGVVSPQKCFC